jgi:hypothetical protein
MSVSVEAPGKRSSCELKRYDVTASSSLTRASAPPRTPAQSHALRTHVGESAAIGKRLFVVEEHVFVRDCDHVIVEGAGC